MALKIFGLLLVTTGTLLLFYQAITYRSSRTVDLGSTQITEKSDRTLPVSPIVGALVFLSGVGVLVAAVKRKD
jgi:hypothetical protein